MARKRLEDSVKGVQSSAASLGSDSSERSIEVPRHHVHRLLNESSTSGDATGPHTDPLSPGSPSLARASTDELNEIRSRSFTLDGTPDIIDTEPSYGDANMGLLGSIAEGDEENPDWGSSSDITSRAAAGID
ncbi:MAG: hypothetical protein Q9169_008533 [Polycauliona sp. 2 TL-2023]